MKTDHIFETATTWVSFSVLDYRWQDYWRKGNRCSTHSAWWFFKSSSWHKSSCGWHGCLGFKLCQWEFGYWWIFSSFEGGQFASYWWFHKFTWFSSYTSYQSRFWHSFEPDNFSSRDGTDVQSSYSEICWLCKFNC